MATKTISLYIARNADGDEVVVPTLEQLSIRRFALERQIEELGQEQSAKLDALLAEMEERQTNADPKDKPFWNRVLAAVSTLSTDARRAEIMTALTSIDRWERSYKKHVGSRLSSVEKRVYRFHPFTMDERIEARLAAESVDDMTGNVKFDSAVYSREIVGSCVENLTDFHADAGSVPTAIGDALFDAIRQRSEPSLDEIFFIVASLETCETE